MDRITPLLAQYPGPVTLRIPGNQRLALFAVAVGILVGTLIWAVVPSTDASILARLGVILFAICLSAIVAAVAWARDRYTLVLDAQGFATTSASSRTQYIWTEVQDFAVVKDDLAPRSYIGFDRVGSDPSVRQRLPNWRDVTLSESYGLTVAECVELLSHWQQRALSKA
jgi:hypothetical protein